ncbi:AraC family transcriptional regulator [Paenibacillus motobuensis]|uniref:helix-turn-helix domain-containing protein n=1 Tax=Paenibacillus TaxID=44249 RepID=UPI00203A6E53|nr:MULTISPECIES: AraC family transcriptional regulator [Paenibacillus]MCM3040311.1 AraC family transcriptional regulator [Paenibacillus lutimineralis]MCM3647415.1 AraC family transcriptional regulator [Paenibacillus motobuensis]
MFTYHSTVMEGKEKLELHMFGFPYELILYFSRDHISFLTNKVDADDHSHHYIQFTIGLEQPVSITVEGQLVQAPGLFLQSSVIHQLQGHQQWQWYMLINPESTLGELVKRVYLQDSNVCVLGQDQVDQLRQLATKQLYSITSQDDYNQSIRRFMQILRLQEQGHEFESDLDDRIDDVLLAIEMFPSHDLTVRALSQHMYISESRLSHIFKQKVGISLASYIVHHKLRTAFQAIFSGVSMTEAAVEAGFSSSSHFSKTVRDKLGMTARSIVQNSRFLKV